MSVTALEQGGPAMLATLIIASALVQFVLAARMALLRRIFTPTVAGTVLLLIPVSLSPVIVRKLGEVPPSPRSIASAASRVIKRAAEHRPRLHQRRIGAGDFRLGEADRGVDVARHQGLQPALPLLLAGVQVEHDRVLHRRGTDGDLAVVGTADDLVQVDEGHQRQTAAADLRR